ncbi:phosphohydrolase [Aliidongia dinghuensis]|uniref:Phosphohydrolase n=1 Tax=Aliidongia dinghuensis TaxID=1867774 RepID=A0A8J3E685_9PROT|nr:metallophosphoesterase [Aliidongia dinghuensis]GGF39153.1 phosphohydrolase [Aliidongia dinghuensis]
MRIALVTDTHLAPRAAAFAQNWRAVRDWIAEMAPDLIVHLGDITADGAGDASELAAAIESFAGLGLPVRFLPGNHDIGDNPSAPDQPSAHPLDPARLAEYRRIFGPDRWAFEAEGWQIIGLNAQLFGTASQEEAAQFDWFGSTLAGHRGPLGLLLHKPLFRDGPDDREVHERYVPDRPRRRLLDALAGRDLRFVAAGHTHQAREHHCAGVEHVWAPSTAFCIPDALQEPIGQKIVGTMLLHLAPGTHRFELVRPAGLARHNLLDHPETYPIVAEIRARLGAAAHL